MKKFAWKKRLSGLMAVVALLTCSMFVHAEEDTKMVLKFDADTYETGSIATAQVYVYNAQFNAAGFSLSYDTESLTPVKSDGTASDKAGQLITINDRYDEDMGIGTFSVLSRDVDMTEGSMEALFYVNPNAGKTAVADNNGLLVGEVSFLVNEAGIPNVQFATNEDSVDFYAVPCLILNNGAQMEVAYADVQAGDNTVQNVDIGKEVIDKKDEEIRESEAAKKVQSGQNANQTDNNTGAGNNSETANGAGTESGDLTAVDSANKESDGDTGQSGNAKDASAENAGQSDAADSSENEQGMNNKIGQWKVIYVICIVTAIILLVPILVVIICKKRR